MPVPIRNDTSDTATTGPKYLETRSKTITSPPGTDGAGDTGDTGGALTG